jgi:hypothetical protein
MGNVERIERDIQALSPEELAQFRAWFLECDWAAWDRQLKRDVQDETHHASPDFWACYRSLPPEVQGLADRSFTRLKQDPRPPSVISRRSVGSGLLESEVTIGLSRSKPPTALCGSGSATMQSTTSCLANKRMQPTAHRMRRG